MVFKNEFWTATSGDLSQKRNELPVPRKENIAKGQKIVIDPAEKKQNWIGVGAAITDATAALIWKQSPIQRSALLHELFDPQEGGYSTIRIPIGACDFSEQDYYSYDDVEAGEHDRNLDKFSIGEGNPGADDATKDMKYIVPVVQEILKINPAVKIVASPWSAPAWFKTNDKFTMGGRMKFGEWTGMGFNKTHDSFEGIYAQYFARYLEEYQKLGIQIYALTIQNEPSNASTWPSMIWTPTQMAKFGAEYLRPALDKEFPNVKIFFADDNLNAFPDPITKEVTRDQAAAFDGFAFHTYDSNYHNIFNISRYFKNWTLAMTERRCMFKESTEDASHIMMGTIGNWFVRQGLAYITLWNLALDERGLPNVAGSTGRRGVITIDHKTGKVMRNLEYYMLRNFGQDVKPGSIVIGSSSYSPNGYSGGLTSVAFLAPDGDIAAHIYNPTGKAMKAAITINSEELWQNVEVPAWGTITLHKSNGKINKSKPRKDEKFELNPTPIALGGDKAPGKD